VWYYNVGFTSQDDKNSHPAVFPEQLAQDHILSWSNPGDIVLDPMCGSGTTCKMAKLNGRNYIGIDIAEEYVEMARRRVAEVSERC
jgi:site-specific DNA-methyltransferase (adenine-specific)